MRIKIHDIRLWMVFHGFMLFIIRPINTLIHGQNEITGQINQNLYTHAIILGIFSLITLLLTFVFLRFKSEDFIYKNQILLKIKLSRFIQALVVWLIIFLYLNIDRMQEGILNFIFSDKSLFIHSDNSFITLTVTFLLNAFILFSFDVDVSKSQRKILIFIVFLISTLAGITTGSKTLTLLPIFLLIFKYSASNNGINFSTLIIFLTFGLISFYFIDILRHQGIDGISQLLTIDSERSFQFQSVIQGIILRSYGTDIVYKILESHNNLVASYLFGSSIFSIIFFPIPRFFWPDKPIISFGKIVSETYLFDNFHDTGISAAPTWIGELYANFSFFSLPVYILSTLVIIYIIKKISRANNWIGAYYWPLSFPTFAFFQEASIAGWVLNLLVIYTSTLFIYKFLTFKFHLAR